MDQWYSNKELFEQITSLKMEMQDMSTEMKETREIIKKYNGLREEVGQLKLKIANIESNETTKKAIAKAIREWGGWILAILAFILNIIKL